MKESNAGLDGIGFELILNANHSVANLEDRTLLTPDGKEYGKIEVRSGRVRMYLCLPRCVRTNNVMPFGLADMGALDAIRSALKRELDSIGNRGNCWLNSVECNLTQRVSGAATPDQALNLLHRCYADKTNLVYEGPSKRCKFHKEKETLIIRSKNYYVLKCYNKTLQQKNEGNTDVEDRVSDNYHLKAPPNRYYYEIQSRIEAAKCKVRRDSIKYVDTFIGGTHEFMTELTAAEQKEFFQRAYDFLAGQLGEQNIFSAIVHMDEYTPHMHLCFVPLTPDNRLSAKEVLGNRDKMIKWQDDFYTHMSERWPELQRGEPAAETGRKHIPTRLLKQALRLDEKAREISDALADINVFNAGKKRDAALRILSKGLPDAENFTSQVKSVDGWIRKLETALQVSESRRKDDVADLKDTISEKDESLFRYHQEVRRLQENIRQQQRLLDRITPEMMEELKKKGVKIRER